MKVPEGLWRVFSGGPAGSNCLPWDIVRIAHPRCHWPAGCAFACARDAGGSTIRGVGISGIVASRSAGGWSAAGRRPSGNSNDAGGQTFGSNTRPRNNAGGLAGRVYKSLRRQPWFPWRKSARGHAAERTWQLFVTGRDATRRAGNPAAAQLVTVGTIAGGPCGELATGNASG
jgi:hypothetical protein